MFSNQIWNNDLDFSTSMLPLIDDVYKDVFGDNLKLIKRLSKPGELPHPLDKKLGIDTILFLENGLILTVQEKTRRPEQVKWQDFTLENKSNNAGVKGEFHHLCTDLYFYGCGDPDQGFLYAYIFATLPVKLAITDGRLKGLERENSKHSTATFFAYSFKDFDSNWFIYKKEYNK